MLTSYGIYRYVKYNKDNKDIDAALNLYYGWNDMRYDIGHTKKFLVLKCII